MGEYEGASTLVELTAQIQDFICGYAKDHPELVRLLYISEEIALFVLERERGYNVLLRAMLEGRFVLNIGVDQSIYISCTDFPKIIGSVTIEKALNKNGYIIRRKNKRGS